MYVRTLLAEALRLTGLGMGMVFAVLAAFYGLVRALTALFPGKNSG